MTETPQQHVERLERELAAAKVAQLQQELTQARRDAGADPSGRQSPAASGYQLPRLGSVDLAGPAAPAPVRADRDHVPGPPGINHSLSATPRRVPASFKAAMLPWRWWDAWILLMVGVTPIAAWVFLPASAAAVGIVTFIALCWFRFRGLRIRLGILKWGVAARVRSAGPLSIGTYYSGTTYQNVRLPVAHGWQVSRDWYSGPGYKTKVVYDVNGVENELILHGREYVDGVILADSRKPEIALCVSQFPYDLQRDRNGDWVPHVGPGLWIGSILEAALYLAWLAVSIYLAIVYWPPLL